MTSSSNAIKCKKIGWCSIAGQTRLYWALWPGSVKPGSLQKQKLNGRGLEREKASVILAPYHNLLFWNYSHFPLKSFSIKLLPVMWPQHGYFTRYWVFIWACVQTKRKLVSLIRVTLSSFSLIFSIKPRYASRNFRIFLDSPWKFQEYYSRIQDISKKVSQNIMVINQFVL